MDGLTRTAFAHAHAWPYVGWEIVSVGEFGISAARPFPPSDPSEVRPDILWRHSGSGEVVIWFMDGPELIDGHLIGAEPDTNWKIPRSGRPARHRLAQRDHGRLRIWMQGHDHDVGFASPAGVDDAGWTVAGAGTATR